MNGWDELEVTKRTLNLGTAGVLDAPDFEIPPFATGTAVVTWKTSGEKKTLLKDRTVEVTAILAISKVRIDEKSIEVPERPPQLPFDGDTATAGEAVDAALAEAVKAAAASGAEVPPHQYRPDPQWQGEGAPGCELCGLASTSGVHKMPEPKPADLEKARRRRTGPKGTMKAARRPRARG